MMKFKYDATPNSWISRKGNNRQENRDFCNVYINSNFIFAILVDATKDGSNGIAFSKDLIGYLIDFVKQQVQISPTLLRSELINAHIMLKSKGYLHEKAAFALLVLNTKDGLAWTLNCGDCRVGGFNNNNEAKWLTPVHSAANALGEDFTIEHAQSTERNNLTRCIRMRRFDEPTIKQFHLNDFKSWIMATDGFWVDHVLLGNEMNVLDDDASALTLNSSSRVISMHTDCSNFEYQSNIHSKN